MTRILPRKNVVAGKAARTGASAPGKAAQTGAPPPGPIPKRRGRAMLQFLIAMLLFGSIGLFRRAIPLSSAMLAMLRGLLGGGFLFLIGRYFSRASRQRSASPALRQLSPVPHRTRLALIGVGILIGLNWIFLFEAYLKTSIANATLAYYMQPTIVVLLSPLVFRERLSLPRFLCAMVALGGMVLVSGVVDGILARLIGTGGPTSAAAGTSSARAATAASTSAAVAATNSTGILLGLAAGALYATVVMLNKKIVLQNAIQKTRIELVAAAIPMIFYIGRSILVTGKGMGGMAGVAGALRAAFLGSAASPVPTGLAWVMLLVLVVSLVHTGLAYLLYFKSIETLPAQTTAVFSYLDPVFALVLAAVFAGERMSLAAILGAVLILGSAVLGEWLGAREKAGQGPAPKATDGRNAAPAPEEASPERNSEDATWN